MSPAAILGGLACGMLLAAVSVTLWDGYRQVPGLSLALQLIGRLAGAALLIGALLAWRDEASLASQTLRLMLTAALAVPQDVDRGHSSPWGRATRILPALVLTLPGVFTTSGLVGVTTGGISFAPATWAMLAAVACGGLGARAMGEALSKIIASTPRAGRTADAVYALLTLLVSGRALTNLLQRGTVWGGTSTEHGSVGAWLAWSAAHLGPRSRPRLRSGLIVVAALLLLWALIGQRP